MVLVHVEVFRISRIEECVSFAQQVFERGIRQLGLVSNGGDADEP